MTMSLVCLKALLAGALLTAPAALSAVERPVGIEAQGVDPMSAVVNPGGLDVRDELGRPVSARVIETQIKAAQASAAEDGAFASRLPQARGFTRMLELLEGFVSRLRVPRPALPMGEIWGVTLKRLSHKAPARRAVFAGPSSSAPALPISCRPFLTSAFAGAPEVLRC